MTFPLNDRLPWCDRGLSAIAIVLVMGLASPVTASEIVADFVGDKLIGVTPVVVQFTNLSTYPADPDVEFLWDFGDGTLGVGKNPLHVYENEGVFTVSLAVHLGEDVDTKTRMEYVTTYTLKPEFDGSPRFAVPPFQTAFTNLTPAVGHFPVAYYWDFGDGSGSSELHPTHNYFKKGAYDVSLRATADGRTVTRTKLQYIQAASPAPDFRGSPRLGNSPLKVWFYNETDTFGFPVTYLWEFGDGNTSTEVNPIHEYESPGTYSVTLNAITDDGTVVDLTKPDYVNVVFDADFYAIPTAGIVPLAVKFTSVIPPDLKNVETMWQFGDGTTSDERHPLHTYEVPGAYDVSLRVTADAVEKNIVKPELVYAQSPGSFIRILDCGDPAVSFPFIRFKLAVYTDAGENCELAPIDFRVEEEGILQGIQSATCQSTGATDTDFVFIIDSSGSMGDEILEVRERATAFAHSAALAGLNPRFGLVTYEADPTLRLGLTSDQNLLKAALDKVSLDGGRESALDAVVFALENLSFRSCAQRVLILITDEPSNGDGHSLIQTADAIVQSDALLAAVSSDGLAGHEGIDVKVLAEATGGIWTPLGSADFLVILQHLIDTVRTGWTVTYRTSKSAEDGTTRSVKITVNDPVEGEGSDFAAYTAPLASTDIALRESFRNLDEDGDARLNLGESGLSPSQFDSLDLDGDGSLTLAEILIETVGPVEQVSLVWVDFNYGGTETGAQATPFNSLDEAIAFIAPGGEVRVIAGHTDHTYTGGYALRKPVIVTTFAGNARVGALPTP